jgi:antitoxin HigA-1
MTSNTPPVHPGRVLYEQAMQPLGVSRNKLARDIDVPVGRISDIVSGKRGITPDTALRLSKYFGTDAELWMRLQSDYDLQVARDTIWPEVEPRVRAFEPAAGQAIEAAPIQAPVPVQEEIRPEPAPASETAVAVEDTAAVTEEVYVPWRLEISGEEEEDSLDIPELEEPVFPIDPIK